MNIITVSDKISLSPQIQISDIKIIATQGFKSIICNRPDQESGAVSSSELERMAVKHGMSFHYMPVASTDISDSQIDKMASLLGKIETPILAYCGSGKRAGKLYQATKEKADQGSQTDKKSATNIVIVGGGAAGIASASSLLERSSGIQITIIEPADVHYYQPGWTMVGAGVFESEATVKTMASQMPGGVRWIKKAITTFEPEQNSVTLENGETVTYDQLIVCPGLALDWQAIDGLEATLGRNGVTSNYRFDLAPYTWELVSSMKQGKALFTQPPMPIKCAGAPQKAMYLSADHWARSGVLKNIDIEFNNAGGVLFAVKDYVAALMEYVEKYQAKLSFSSNLIAIDGEKKIATFLETDANGKTKKVKKPFDMIHICPPQKAHAFIAASPLADATGWVDVDQTTLQHTRYSNIWALGDAANTPNAKTAAAVRKQAPIIAENLLSVIAGHAPTMGYTGYGSCPLTVERGRIILAEFGYGGSLQPTLPTWLLKGTRPTRLAWFLKEKVMPYLYWHGMLKGKEWLAKPKKRAS
ncbi:bifunctional protein tyrosine phosphatase family protein/NAD(P)/FAD-dependent oxidoreductase [Alphaproteobacteria bacterium]|nr:bifunctional protein tyrosine phosphatase family protein/NAD(P)/FAD-dependent oxidoreductase [Alphaproteobacteria bacterium]